MERINKIRNKKQQFIANKASKFFSSTSILKLSIALALFFIAAFMISGAGVTVENGALNVSSNLLVNTNTLYVDSANNRAGIGTTAPGKKFRPMVHLRPVQRRLRPQLRGTGADPGTGNRS